MVIAVVTVGMVQVTIHEIVDVISMRDSFVSAAGAVYVVASVRITHVAARAVRGIGGVHLNGVFIDMIIVNVVQMTVVEIVNVSRMLDRCVATAFAVSVVVAFDFLAVAHRILRCGLVEHDFVISTYVEISFYGDER